MNNDIIKKIFKKTLIISLFFMGISFFLFNEPKPIILGYIFGTIISMLGLKLIDNTINKAIKMSPDKANGYTTFHYILRYFIYFIVLSIAAIADYLNFPAAILGLLMVKIVIITSTIFDKDFVK